MYKVFNVSFLHAYPPMKMELTVFRNVGLYNSDSGELHRRKHTSRNKYFELITFDTFIYSSILLKKYINYIQVKYMEKSMG